MTENLFNCKDYNLEKALAHGWNSINSKLNPIRQKIVDDFVLGPKVLDVGCA